MEWGASTMHDHEPQTSDSGWRMQRLSLRAESTVDAVLDAAVRHLEAGGVVAAPTETVYGLMTLWDNAAGRERIFALKRRPPEKRLQMLASDLAQAERHGVRPDARLRALSEAFWPGPLTVVCRAADGDTIGLRIPHHGFMHRLLVRLGSPLAATSANPSGEPPAADAASAIHGLDGAPDLLIDGGTVQSLASTVVSLVGDALQVLRDGPIAAAEIGAVLSRTAGSTHALSGL